MGIFRLLMVMFTITQSQSMELAGKVFQLASYYMGSETVISDSRSYAQQCIDSKNEPILNCLNSNESDPLRDLCISPGQLMVDLDHETTPSSVFLRSSKADKLIKCSVDRFKMTHYHSALEQFVVHPWWFVGGYGVSYLLPTMVSAPLIGVGLIAGLAYSYWQNQNKIMAAEKNWEGIKQLSGLSTTLGQALFHSGTMLTPAYLSSGKVHFQGYVPNGVIPGQYLYVDLMVTPLSEKLPS